MGIIDRNVALGHEPLIATDYSDSRMVHHTPHFWVDGQWRRMHSLLWELVQAGGNQRTGEVAGFLTRVTVFDCEVPGSFRMLLPQDQNIYHVKFEQMVRGANPEVPFAWVAPDW